MIRSRFLVLTLLTLGLFGAHARAQEKVFTLDDILDFQVFLAPEPSARVAWSPDGKSYLRTEGDRTVEVSLVTGQETPSTQRVAPRPATGRPPRRATPGRPAPQSAPVDRAAAQSLLDGVDGTNKSASPDARWIAYVRAGNLFLQEVATKKERQVTRDGGGAIQNGRLDWVYEEEIYGRGNTTGYAWSPDSRRIAFLRLDESPVQSFTLLDHLPTRQSAESTFYPKAGDPNPNVRLGLVDVEKAEPVFVDLSRYPEEDRLVVRYSFTPDSKQALFQIQNREQTWLDLCAADAATGKNVRIVIHEEEKHGWTEVTGYPRWLQDGTFLWESDRSGYRHLYRYRADGTLVNAVTKGDWDVRRLLRVDEAGGWVYFDANAQRVTDAPLYRARLDGKGDAACLTQGAGVHRIDFAPDGNHFFDYYSSIDNPGEVRLCRTDGTLVKVVSKSAPPEMAKTHRLGTPRFVSFAARDGYPLEGILILPPGYDPSKRYPVYCPVYAGPGAPTALNGWQSTLGNPRTHFLAQKGVVTWLCDNRSANPRGVKAQKCIYKNLGRRELEDIEDGVRHLIALGIADPGRIAIDGWSYGGFMVEYALTHSKLFKIGIAGAGVADWRLYDSIYTERYMSTPQKNPDGYQVSSSVQAASNLSGKLLLLHGLMDDNVHAQNSLQLAYALQQAGKDFQTMFYPSPAARHGIGDRNQSRHLQKLSLTFLLENL